MSEQEIIDQMAEEFRAISVMLIRAEQNGLSVEVIDSFGKFRASGDSVLAASVAALWEWDL